MRSRYRGEDPEIHDFGELGSILIDGVGEQVVVPIPGALTLMSTIFASPSSSVEVLQRKIRAMVLATFRVHLQKHLDGSRIVASMQI